MIWRRLWFAALDKLDRLSFIEALEDELVENLVLRELKKMSAGMAISLDVKPVKPKVETSAGDVVREMRWRRG